MNVRIQWRPRAVKDFDRLDARVQRRVATALERLAATKQGDVRKLTDTDPPEWRLRVGDWRVLFARDKAAGVLTVLRVLPRGKAYR